MFKFALIKQSAQSNLFSPKQACEESSLNIDETINISKFPLLYATPERTKTESATKRELVTRQVKSSVKMQHANNSSVTSPIDMSYTSIKHIDYEFDQAFINQKSNNSLPLAYINQVSNSPLCSTATVDSFYSFSASISSQDDTFDEQTEQFHSVNGSFFDFNRRDTDTKDLFYVCCQSFQAIDPSQLSLNYSDLVKLIYVKGDLVLVQHMINEKRGFVPKEVISNLTKSWINSKSLNI